MKFSLAAGTRPKADAFGLKSAGLNGTAKPKKAFSFSKMIPRQAALFAKTMRGGPPKLKAFLQRGYSKACGSPLKGSPCHGFGPMAIAIGLHHRHQLGARAKVMAESPGVGTNR